MARLGHGTYGIDYVARAVVDSIGLGAPRSSLAIYPFTVTDRNLHPLTGATRYVAHFSPRYLPFPVRAFWSLTLYDSHGFFVPNSARRYLINDLSVAARGRRRRSCRACPTEHGRRDTVRPVACGACVTTSPRARRRASRSSCSRSPRRR